MAGMCVWLVGGETYNLRHGLLLLVAATKHGLESRAEHLGVGLDLHRPVERKSVYSC